MENLKEFQIFLAASSVRNNMFYFWFFFIDTFYPYTNFQVVTTFFIPSSTLCILLCKLLFWHINSDKIHSFILNPFFPFLYKLLTSLISNMINYLGVVHDTMQIQVQDIRLFEGFTILNCFLKYRFTSNSNLCASDFK